MSGCLGLPKGLEHSPMENSISDFIMKNNGKKLLSEMCFTDELAGRYHSTLKHVVLSLNNFFFVFHSMCILREFMVNLYLSFHPPNSRNLCKSYFSILSSFFLFSPGLYPRLADPKVMYQPVPQKALSCQQFQLAIQSCHWFLGSTSPNDELISRTEMTISCQSKHYTWLNKNSKNSKGWSGPLQSQHEASLHTLKPHSVWPRSPAPCRTQWPGLQIAGAALGHRNCF